ncbi:hypothetical protein [Paenibacillus lemnae]|uniref:DUF4306 domain-containing protein n=1 Tax=Paenibacillus lemnae TaxID=1330551 RepID=A0A848MDY0_PAELE|nr:hypothetical protein [Paenibacillus lemnae]NMO98262.1 hypothetical protein [Paenibacillus lemnae]
MEKSFMGRIHPHYYLGALSGLIIGYVISKIYQVWAIVYRESRFDPNMSDSWNTNSPPIWVTATENPNSFSFWVVLIYIIIGIIFVRLLQIKINKETGE